MGWGWGTGRGVAWLAENILLKGIAWGFVLQLWATLSWFSFDGTEPFRESCFHKTSRMAGWWRRNHEHACTLCSTKGNVWIHQGFKRLKMEVSQPEKGTQLNFSKQEGSPCNWHCLSSAPLPTDFKSPSPVGRKRVLLNPHPCLRHKREKLNRN